MDEKYIKTTELLLKLPYSYPVPEETPFAALEIFEGRQLTRYYAPCEQRYPFLVFGFILIDGIKKPAETMLQSIEYITGILQDFHEFELIWIPAANGSQLPAVRRSDIFFITNNNETYKTKPEWNQ